jgi:hypothetical protein
MTTHTEYPLGCASISEIFDLALTIPTTKASCAERLVASEDSEVFDLIAACTAAVCTIVADERAVTE